MSQPSALPGDLESLRHRAEQLIREAGSQLLPPASLQIVSRAFHELRVHQIELEMQAEELRRAQAELELSRERYFDLYDLAPVGYLTIDEDGLILEANLTAASLLGVPRASLVRRAFSSLIFAQDEDIYYRHRRRLGVAGERQTSELRLLRPDHTSFWVSVESAAAHDASGNLQTRLIMSDISERKQAAARIAQAERLESISLLAGGVAHEFNNLLTVINGYSNLLLDRMHAGEANRAEVEAILKSGVRAAKLTGQLLAFGRRQTLRPRPLDLNRLVSDARPMLECLLHGSIELKVNLHPAAGLVLADPQQMEQVLLNLVTNARDAMSGGGRIWIETAAIARDANAGTATALVRLSVRDNGPGMDPETCRRAFEPFFTTKSVGEGTGLGLSMVQGFIEQSGGYVELHSEPGSGTDFRMYLPVVLPTLEAQADTAAPEPLRARGGHETVLIVEDEPAVLELIATTLTLYGYRVKKATDGAEALRLREEADELIDLVLSDLNMPNLSGRELAPLLQRRWPAIKVLFMSGFLEGSAGPGDVACSTVEFIQKPFGPGQLALRIRALLDRAPG